VIESVIALLRDGKPLEETICACRDVRKFVSLRAVTGGANVNGVYLGKAVRWYYAENARENILNYKRSGNKVPKTDGSKPLMELPDEFPKDVNYGWYIAEARDVLVNLGYAQGDLFEDAA
jgi:hypothetical protein